MSLATTTERGSAAEDAAHAFLRKEGLTSIDRNFRCKMGEIDLIMRDDRTLVFVEVRLRRNPDYASGAESITRTKMKRLARTAEYWLQRHDAGGLQCRFDVVSMGTAIDWIKDAFTLDDC